MSAWTAPGLAETPGSGYEAVTEPPRGHTGSCDGEVLRAIRREAAVLAEKIDRHFEELQKITEGRNGR